uniref:Uncharacterized protein n=1 Tax=Avena sativa TaxID=4498 RepID=A0ACD5YMF7_AVESA
MPALTSTRPSAVQGEIHRELDQRRKLAAVAKGRIMKNSSAPSSIRNAAAGAVIQNKPAPIPHEPARAATKNPSLSTPRAPAIAYLQLGEAPKRHTAPKGRPAGIPFPRKQGNPEAARVDPARACRSGHQEPVLASMPMPHKSAEAATKKSSAPISHAPARVANKKPSSAPIPETTPPLLPSTPASESVKRGSTVRVRTPVGTLPTGLCLVLWLSARVITDAEDGYLEVIYNGDFPRDDPFRTVRVARDQGEANPNSAQITFFPFYLIWIISYRRSHCVFLWLVKIQSQSRDWLINRSLLAILPNRETSV